MKRLMLAVFAFAVAGAFATPKGMPTNFWEPGSGKNFRTVNLNAPLN